MGDHGKISEFGYHSTTSINYVSKGNPPGEVTDLFFGKLKGNGSKIFLMDEEGGITDMTGSAFRFRFDKRVIRHYDHVFVWGEKSRPYIEANTDKFTVVGNPRFDTANAKTAYINPEFDVIKFLDGYDKKILVNTSFGSGNNRQESLERLHEVTEQIMGAHYSREEFDLYIQNQRLLILYMKKMVRILAEKYPDTAFVLRPHPSEKPDTYFDLAESHKNVFVDQNRKLSALVLATLFDLVIHHDCTTGIEALINKNRVIAYVPVHTEYCQHLPIESSRRIETLDGIVDVIENLRAGSLDESEFIPKNLEEIRSYIMNFASDEENASEIARICMDLAADDSSSNLESLIKELKDSEHDIKLTAKQKIMGSAKRLLYYSKYKKHDARKKRIHQQKRGVLSNEDVTHMLDRLNKEYNTQVQLHSAGNGVFVLSK